MRDLLLLMTSFGPGFRPHPPISTYHKAPSQSPAPQSESNKNISAAISGTYKDDDSKYSLKNLLKRQEMEDGYEE